MTTRTRRRLVVGAPASSAWPRASLACQGPATGQRSGRAHCACQTYWGGDDVTEAGEHDIDESPLTAPEVGRPR